MRRREAGVTFIGWIVLLIPMAIMLYACIRLTPIYLNYFKVAKAVEAVASENGAEPTVSVATVRRDLDNRFNIEGISFPDTKDIAVVREGEGWVIEASYEQVAPLFGSIQLLVSFDKREPIR